MTISATVPILPCPDIDEIASFYTMLGFEVTYRQERPNPYLALRRDGFDLHFAAIAEFDPETSYGSCLVVVDDTGPLFEAFAAGMRAVHGKILINGIPRMTRPRKRKNAGGVTGFTVVDPGGNWIRIIRGEGAAPAPAASEPLARALENAVVLADSRGDEAQAAKVLDGTLARKGDAAPVTVLIEALVYRAELALRLGEPATAAGHLDRVAAMPLDDAQRELAAEALANAEALEQALTGAATGAAGGPGGKR